MSSLYHTASAAIHCKCRFGPSVRCSRCNCPQCKKCDGTKEAINCAVSSCPNLLSSTDLVDTYTSGNAELILCKQCSAKEQWSKPAESNCVFCRSRDCSVLCTDCAAKELRQCIHCGELACKREGHYHNELQACFRCFSYCSLCGGCVLDKDIWTCGNAYCVRGPGRFCSKCAVSDCQIANRCIDKHCTNNHSICRYCEQWTATSLCTDCNLELQKTLTAFAKTVYVEQITTLLRMQLPLECPLQLRALILHYANIFHPDTSVEELRTAFSVSIIRGFPHTVTQKNDIENPALGTPSHHTDYALFDASTAEQY